MDDTLQHQELSTFFTKPSRNIRNYTKSTKGRENINKRFKGCKDMKRKVKLAKKRPENNNFDSNKEVQLTQKRLKMTTNQLGQNLTLISR